MAAPVAPAVLKAVADLLHALAGETVKPPKAKRVVRLPRKTSTFRHPTTGQFHPTAVKVDQADGASIAAAAARHQAG
jgi:hypothetical protein